MVYYYYYYYYFFFSGRPPDARCYCCWELGFVSRREVGPGDL